MFKSKVKIVVLLLATIISCLALYFVENNTNALEVEVNGKKVAYVTDKSLVFEAEKEEEAALKSRFSNVLFQNDINFRAVKIELKEVSSKEELDNNIKANLKGYVQGVAIRSSEGEIGNAANIKEATEILLKIRAYYIGQSGIKTGDIQDISLKDKIYIENTNIQISAIKSTDAMVNSIINASKEKSNVNFQIEGIKNNNELVTYLDSKQINSIKTNSNYLINQNSVEVSSNSKSAFRVPVIGKITSPFGMRWGQMHEGIDIAANMGAPIYAALSGKITYAGWENGYGNFIMIDHGNNLASCYGHCSKITVALGTVIKKGDKIGEIGSTGNSTGPHLHFEIRYNGKAQNPTNYLNFTN